jgi:hypothetical protein
MIGYSSSVGDKSVGVEKVTSISRMRFGRSMLKKAFAHALLVLIVKPADHDGAATAPKRCSATSVWKIRFLRLICG